MSSDNLKKLARLKSMREKVNLKNEDERFKFLGEVYPLISNWKYKLDLSDVLDIFQKKEIETLLEDAVNYEDGSNRRYKGRQFIKFIARTGYKHEPDVDQYGKPILCQTTPVHHAIHLTPRWDNVVSNLFQIYDRYDVNYTNDDGLTHFHVACKFNCFEVVKKFLELGQNPNIVVEKTGASPLHLALEYEREDVVELLLKSGADPNLANKNGSTPLHIICQIDNIDDALIDEDAYECGEEYRDLTELFFKVNDEMQRSVQIDARDKWGWTPLQWAVASLKPDVFDVLLDRGADLSSFVFPTEDYFGECCSQRHKESWPHFTLRLASSVLITVERLEKRGYELKRSDAQTILQLFGRYNLFGKSEDLNKWWYDDSIFVRGAKALKMMNPSLSLYDVIQLRPEEAAKQLTYKDYFKFDYANRRCYPYGILCSYHPLEIMLRRFCRRWSLEPFMELTHNRLPILCCEMILDQLMNRDLCNICLASAVKI